MDRISERFIHPPRIITPRMILRGMNRRDCADMYEYARDPEVTRYLLWAPHDSPDYTKRYLKQVEAAYRRGEFYDLGAELISENKFIGTCGIASIDLPNNTAEIGYVINPKYHNMGLATEAARAVIRYCFEELGFNRVEARYMVGNEPSRRVMEKCGMQFEGIKRSSLFVKDGYCDVGICAIIADDYFSRYC